MSIPGIEAYALPTTDALPINRVNWQVNKQRAVLLIHDMQEYFLGYYGVDNPLIKNLVSNIASIYAWAKKHGMPVVYTAQPAEQSPAQRALLNDMWGPGLVGVNPEQEKICAVIAPEKNDTVLVKWRYSAFQRTQLKDLMQEWSRDQLIITGVYAHIGCMATSLDAFMNDIQPFLVGDAVADFSQQDHLMALNYVAGRCGFVLNSDQLLGPTPAYSLSKNNLKMRLLQFLGDEGKELQADDNLIDYGLDSMQVMTLISEWNKLGLQLRFEELAERPSLNGWWDLIQAKQAV